MPVSARLKLTHNKAQSTPVDLLRRGAKYMSLVVDGLEVWVAAEAVACGGASHCLRSGCAMSKQQASEAKRRARGGHFVRINPCMHFFAVEKRKGMEPTVRGKMLPVALVYAECPSDLQRSFRCVLADAMALVGLSKTDPRTPAARDFVRDKDAEAQRASGTTGAKYLWQNAHQLYPPAGSKRRAGRGRYFFLASAWLDSSSYMCEYRAAKGPQSHGYSDGVFRRL